MGKIHSVGIPSPNPNFPQEIKNVEGTITITKSNADNTQSKTYNFPLSENQVLMQDGTIENKVINEWGEIELDGSNDEGWTKQYTNYFVTGNFENVVVDNVNTKCTIATVLPIADLQSNSVNKFSVNPNGSFWFRCPQFNNSLTDWKNYLAENPIKIQYKLATPNETAFTTDQQNVIDEIINDGTYDEVTHYTSTALVNPDIEAVGIKDIRKVIENLDARLTLVEE